MSLYGAMFSGVSGLNANSQALGAIADNITNVNTPTPPDEYACDSYH